MERLAVLRLIPDIAMASLIEEPATSALERRSLRVCTPGAGVRALSAGGGSEPDPNGSDSPQLRPLLPSPRGGMLIIAFAVLKPSAGALIVQVRRTRPTGLIGLPNLAVLPDWLSGILFRRLYVGDGRPSHRPRAQGL